MSLLLVNKIVLTSFDFPYATVLATSQSFTSIVIILISSKLFKLLDIPPLSFEKAQKVNRIETFPNHQVLSFNAFSSLFSLSFSSVVSDLLGCDFVLCKCNQPGIGAYGLKLGQCCHIHVSRSSYIFTLFNPIYHYPNR